MNKDELMWTTDSERQEMDCGIFRVKSVWREAAENRKGQFTVLDACDWVTVIPVVKNSRGNNSILIVRQYRHGIAAISREFPAGMVDEGESAEEAALRELEEETGYHAAKLTALGDVSPNPAFMNNRSYTFLAEDLTPTGSRKLDENELLDMELFSEDELAEKIGTGEFASAITMQAWLWYLKHKSRA